MKQTASKQASPRQMERRSPSAASAGPAGVAIAPPAYGVEAVDDRLALQRKDAGIKASQENQTEPKPMKSDNGLSIQEKEDAQTAIGGVPQAVIDHLRLREGWREHVYLDSLQLPTAGLGHLLTGVEKTQYKVGDKIPLTTLEAWARADTKKAYRAAEAQASTLGISDQRFINALAAVNFQLGTAWHTKHKKTWAHMVAHEWEKAALEVQNSLWYTQTPVRVQDFQAALRALSSTSAVMETSTATSSSPRITDRQSVQAPTGSTIGNPDKMAATPATTKLDAFALSGSVGKPIPGKKGLVAAKNFAKDVKMIQDFFVATGYMKADDAEIAATKTIAEVSPTAKISATSLSNTISAIFEWQKKGATKKGFGGDGQISKTGRSVEHMDILTAVYNKYGSEKPLEETKLVLSVDKWHTQGRYGFNYSGGDNRKEADYKAYVKQVAGIDDPADLYKASEDAINKIKSNSKFATTRFYAHEDVKAHGIREQDKGSDPKPNWVCCFDAAKKMLGYTGATPHGENQKIQTFVENAHTGGEFTPQARIGFHYIDGQLRNGKAVFVGVDKIDIKDDKNDYNEGITDHFIVIVGKGKDAAGWYFRYFDPATTHLARGTNQDNKLYISANYQSVSGGNYNVAQIRVNEEVGI